MALDDSELSDEPPRPAPTEGADDELLAEIPDEPRTGGAFAGYTSSRRVRWFVGGALFVGIVGAIQGGRWYVESIRERARRGIDPVYDTTGAPSGDEDRVMHWDSGPARLGLSRKAPGVHRIVLPDREIRLADGYDSAQVSVRVENGRTVKLRVLSGRIDVTRPSAAE